MNMIKKYSLALLMGSVLLPSVSLIKAMDMYFGDEAESAPQVAPSQEAIDAYKQDVGRRMKKLFDALMVAPTQARLGEDAAAKLAKLFDSTGAEGSLLHFYHQEFMQRQAIFTEDLEQDWPDQSYCDALFTTLINCVTHFLSWARQDVLPVLGGNKYRINIDGDDMISLFFAEIFNLEPRVKIQKGGAATGITRAMYWLEQINNIWALPDMPEFGFDFGGGAAEEGDEPNTAPRGRYQRGPGGMPFFAISGKGVVVNNGQMAVVAQAGSKNIVKLEADSSTVIYIPVGANVQFMQANPSYEEGLGLPASLGTLPNAKLLALTDVAESSTKCLDADECEKTADMSSALEYLSNSGHALVKNTRGFISGAAFWIGLDYVTRGSLNLADTPEVAIVALVVGGITQGVLAYCGSAR